MARPVERTHGFWTSTMTNDFPASMRLQALVYMTYGQLRWHGYFTVITATEIRGYAEPLLVLLGFKRFCLAVAIGIVSICTVRMDTREA